MNCKQGDLAVVVRSSRNGSANIGKIVRCVEFAPAGTQVSKGKQLSSDGWLTDSTLEIYGQKTGSVSYTRYANDYSLKPLRDNDDQDETLTWAGKPQKEPA